MGEMSESMFQVQPSTQILIYFVGEGAAWAGK